MKIGFNARVLAIPQMRGWTRYTTELLRALSCCDGIELVLFTLEDLCPDHLRGIRAKVVQAGARREMLWNDVVLPRMIRREKVDLFHAPADRGLPVVAPCPTVLTLHNSYERAHWRGLFPTWKRRLWYWKNEAVNFFRADAVVTVSDATLQELTRAHIAPPEKLHRVYLAAADGFGPDASEFDFNALSKHKVDAPYVLSVGGYDPHKNLDTLVRAFDASRIQDHLLVIVADQQWQYAELQSAWRQLACFPRMRLIQAPQTELPGLYRHAEIFVNPSLWESFSLPLVEAMTCGTPVLCSDRPAMREVTGGAALTFDPTNVRQLTSLLNQVLTTPDMKRDLTHKARARAEAFSWKNTAEQTLSIYKSVLSTCHA